MNISVNTSEIMATTKKVSSELADLEANYKNLISLVEMMKSAWGGEDSAQFNNAMNTVIVPNLQQIGDVIKAYNQNLTIIANSYNDLDETFASKSIEV